MYHARGAEFIQSCISILNGAMKILLLSRFVSPDTFKFHPLSSHQEAEVNRLTREVEKMKEETNSHLIKVKWAQNKLKSEVDTHKVNELHHACV